MNNKEIYRSENGITEEIVKIYDLFNDENYMPHLKIIKEKHIIHNSGDDLIYNTVESLCLATDIRHFHREACYLSTYDYENCLIGLFPVCVADFTESRISSRVLATFLLLSGAFSFAVFHNHPVDCRTPSIGDKQTSRLYADIAGMLKIRYLGSYIITMNGWASVDAKEDHTFEAEEEKGDERNAGKIGK